MQENEKTPTWKEMIHELYQLKNCAIHCDHFIVTDLYHFLNIQRNYIDQLVINGLDPKKDKGATIRKKNMVSVWKASKDVDKIHKVGWMPDRYESIYPLKFNEDEK